MSDTWYQKRAWVPNWVWQTFIRACEWAAKSLGEREHWTMR